MGSEMPGNEKFLITSDRPVVRYDGQHLPSGTTVLYMDHVLHPDGTHRTPYAAVVRMGNGALATVNPQAFPELRFGRFYV
jgi:hypothetical protein